MTFLNPGILWGLLALAVPIIIHFFNLQRPRQILFSNVAFVKEVKKSVVRRLQFKQWLLLLMRLLAITCLVLAFANPVILQQSNLALRGNRSVAIVLDNSASMSASNERGSYFQQGQALVRNLLNAYSRQDEFLVMTSSDLQLNASFGEQAEVLEAARELGISQNIRSHTDLLSFRKEIFKNASNRQQELYFISDFQRSTVLADSQMVVLNDTTIWIKYIPLATREQSNVYVAGQKILSQIIEKDKPVQMSMTLVNDGSSQVKDLGIRVLLEDKVVAIATKSLNPNASEDIQLSFTPTSSGWLSGYIELDDYPIEYDNRRYFALYVPEEEKVLVVEGQPSRSMRILYEDLFEQFTPTFVAERSLSGVQLSDYRSIVLIGISEISTGMADKIKSFLNEGGSIMFFPGDKLDLANSNAFFSSLGIGSFEAALTVQNGINAGQVELEHPIFNGIFTGERNRREFDAPNVFRYFPFTPDNQSVQNIIMRLDNQAPFLVESKVGKGVVYTFTTFPGNAWTDFHVKTSFAPIIFRATQIMNQTQNVQLGQEIGFFEPLAIRSSSQDLIKLIGQEEMEFIPEQYDQGGATVLSFERLDLKGGTYKLVQGENLLKKIAFNISDLESRLAFAGSDALREMLDAAGYQKIEVLPPQPDALSRQIQIEKEGIPLWKYFVIFTLLFLLAEILILRIGAKS